MDIFAVIERRLHHGPYWNIRPNKGGWKTI